MESYIAVRADVCKMLLKWEMFIIKLKLLYIQYYKVFYAEKRVEVKKHINPSHS